MIRYKYHIHKDCHHMSESKIALKSLYVNYRQKIL